MKRHFWLLPLLCFAAAVVSVLVIVEFVWARQLQEFPPRWVFPLGVAAMGAIGGLAHFLVARRKLGAIAWGLGIAVLSGVFLGAALTTALGS